MSDTPEQSSPNEQSTSAPGAYSDGTVRASTTTSSPITKTFNSAGINLENLSERGKAIKLMIVDEMNDGYDLGTIAKELGQSVSWVSERLVELRHEVELQQGVFFPLTEQEFDALKLSITQYGVQNPILVGDHTLIDGRHRWLASKELGLREVPALFLPGFTYDQEREIGVAVNAARRQLTARQKHALVRSELSRDPARSDRHIAAICGVTHPTVAGARDELIREQSVETTVEELSTTQDEIKERLKPQVRVNKVGREFELREREEKQRDPKFIGYVTCSHGEMHRLLKDGEEYRLEADWD